MQYCLESFVHEKLFFFKALVTDPSAESVSGIIDVETTLIKIGLSMLLFMQLGDVHLRCFVLCPPI